MQLLISLTEKNTRCGWTAIDGFEGSCTILPLPWLQTVLQMLQSASTRHYRLGIHEALWLRKPFRKPHMASICERPHTLQCLCHLLHIFASHHFALLCWFWCRRWSWKPSYFDNTTTVIHMLLLINILRLYYRKNTGHLTSKKQSW